MSTLSVAGLIASYIAMAVLLLSLNLTSLWTWWVKALAVVTVTAFYSVSYASIAGMLGWPAQSRPPEEFQLLSSTIIERNRRTGEEGGIYLWIRRIDENNTPVGAPRAYEIGFDERLARDVAAAQREINEGKEIKGTSGALDDLEGETRERQKLGKVNESSEITSSDDTVPFQDQSQSLSFEQLPPAVLPDKPPPGA